MAHVIPRKGNVIDALLDKVEALADVATTGSYNDLTDKPAGMGDLADVATSGDYNDLTNKPTIPTVPTNVSAFTNDAGYLTQHQDISGFYTKPSGGIPSTDLASTVQTSLGKADSALQSFTEVDPIFTASAAYGISSSDITNWNGKTSNVGTVTGVKMNGGSAISPTNGVVDLGTVITSETSLSKGTTSVFGNAVTDIRVSGHQITLTKGSTFLTWALFPMQE